MASQAEGPQQGERPSLAPSSPSTGLTRTPSGLGANAGFPIARQSSIYSLTLDEFQNALGEQGKSFGFMNMDEFLMNIWTAAESQAMATAMGVGDDTGGSSLGRQQSLQRQGSLSLPRTLSRMTVDDVWKDIYRGNMDAGSDAAPGVQERQATYGEMTLEDFLVKAGAVREDDSGSQSLVPFGAGFEGDCGAAGGGDKTTDRRALGSELGVNFGERGGKGGDEEKPRGTMLPTLSLSPANVPSGQAALQSMQLDPLTRASAAPQQTDWLTHQYRNATAQQQQQRNILQQQAAYANGAKRVGHEALTGPAMGGLGTGLGPTALGLKTGSPSSPVSEGAGPSHRAFSTASPLPYGLDGTLRGRRRSLEGSLEKVVERRQRRMIKNRESAARSRARKQAYTVELEAEVSQLKEENMRLWRQKEEMEERRNNQILGVMASFAQQLAPKTGVLRRTRTGPW